MSKIQCVEDTDQKAKMLEMGLSLFRSHYPLEVLFTPAIEACLMFHPPERDDRDYDYIEKDEYEAVIAAAKHAGDTGFVLCHDFGSFKEEARDQFKRYWTGEGDTYRMDLPTDTAGNESEKPSNIAEAVKEFPTFWWCEFPTYEAYLEIPFARLAHATVYSINGRWALHTAHDFWTLVGGDIDFIREVDKLHPVWRNHMLALIDDWEGDMARDLPFAGLLIELLDYWKKWPGDEWVDTFAAKLDGKLTGGL